MEAAALCGFHILSVSDLPENGYKSSSFQQRLRFVRSNISGKRAVRAHHESGRTGAERVAVRGGEAREATEEGVAIVVAVAEADEHIRRVADARGVEREEEVGDGVR